jgi:type I restriction enzyme M protein
MARTAKTAQAKTLEARLWEAADALRGNQEPSEYKHVVLGLVFLKYISDRFEERRKAIEAALGNPASDDYIPNEARREQFIESRDEYTSHNVFWVPAEARWESIQAKAKLPSIGQDIDKAMDLIEKENPVIRGVLPRNYGREGLDKGRLGQLVDLIGSIGFTETDDHGSDDVLGRVYEYFLGQFAGKETGKDAGAFYTPRPVVKLLVEMLEPYKGRVYDPACGSGGMFVQSAAFIAAHGGRRTDISVYGQEYVDATWKLARMNLALRGIEGDLGAQSADSFSKDQHPDLRADFAIANPPFNISNWWSEELRDDPRWRFGVPPAGNANLAWAQHIIHHLAPRGRAGFVLANMSLASDGADERRIRSGIVDDDLVDCIVTLPDKLFTNTPIAVSLWFLDKARTIDSKREVLFIDASKASFAKSRTMNSITDESIAAISSLYRNWRKSGRVDSSEPTIRAASASVEQIRTNQYILLPAAYVGGTSHSTEDPTTVAEALQGSDLLALLSALGSLESAGEQISGKVESLSADLGGFQPTFTRLRIGDVLEQSKETLGDGLEPEILTCTESSGLVLQRERFAKRVATENTRKYKKVSRGDIVYNPYLLWKGSIDQCRIVDDGITSPAYEVFRVKQGFHPAIVGKLLTSAQMIKRYDGISFGTVERRRRAAPTAFLELEIDLPSGPEVARIGELLDELSRTQQQSREAERSAAGAIGAIFNAIVSEPTTPGSESA